MKTIWDLLKSIKKKEPVRFHKACVVINESDFGESYDITPFGIEEYFKTKGNVEFKLTGVKETDRECHVVLNITDLNTGKTVAGCAVESKSDVDDEDAFVKAVRRALQNGKRELVSGDLKAKLIESYMEEGRFVRIPKENEKIRIFKPKTVLSFVNQAG